jgi:hypothetical protein
VFRSFAKRPLARRLVALAAAYAIALSGLIASFGAVHAAAAQATASGDVICHTARLDQQAPTGDSNSDCNSSCCIGCLLLMASLPPPPTFGIAIVRTSARLLHKPVNAELPADPLNRSHQSRAPPRQV